MHSDNLPNWNGSRESFYEVWYFKLNLVGPSGPGTKSPALWLRFTTLSMQGGLKRVAEVWGIFFEPDAAGNVNKIAVKNTAKLSAPGMMENGKLSLGALQYSGTGQVSIEDSVFGANFTRGSVVSRSSEISWDLSFEPNEFTFFHVPTALTKLKLSKSTVCKPNVNVTFFGSFTVNGKRYECGTGAPGCQGHIWGTRYAHDWAWAHCNSFETKSGPAVIEALTARVKLGGAIVSPQMSAMFFEYKGERYQWNSLWSAFTIKSNYDPTSWAFVAEKGHLRINGKIDCTIRDLTGVTYEDTAGGFLYCYNTELASLAVSVYYRGKLEETLKSSGAAAFETVSRNKNPYVEVLL